MTAAIIHATQQPCAYLFSQWGQCLSEITFWILPECNFKRSFLLLIKQISKKNRYYLCLTFDGMAWHLLLLISILRHDTWIVPHRHHSINPTIFNLIRWDDETTVWLFHGWDSELLKNYYLNNFKRNLARNCVKNAILFLK